MHIRSLVVVAMAAGLLFSCGEPEQPKKEDPSSLVEIKDGVYTEYYPGHKAVKFRGPQDENEMRDGRWFYYAENGTEQSMTEYKHGKKEGVTFVRYPNGTMRYVGEYKDNQPVGKWKTYNQDGSLQEEKDFGTLE